VRALLDQGVNPNTPDKRGLAPLHLAAFMGRRDLVEILVSAGADIQARDKFGRTPLHHAAFDGHKSIVMYLLLHDADPRARSDSGLSPSELAALQDLEELASLLDVASQVDLETVRRLARSLANTPRSSERPDPLVMALLDETGSDARVEPLVTALLDEMRSGRKAGVDRSTSSDPGIGSSGQAAPILQTSGTRRTDRFCDVPVEFGRHGRSWVVSGTDPSVISGDLYAFSESGDYSTIFNRAMKELDSLALEGTESALDAFTEYFKRIGEARQIPDFHRTLEAALMLYTNDRFYRTLNGCWRNNESRALFGFSALMILAFEHAPFFIEGEVYRGVDLADIARYKQGFVFRWPFFVSASTNRAIASQFGKTLFVIDVPASGNVRAIAHCSLYPNEGEVLFFPYEVFEVLESGPTGVRVRISDDIFLGVPGVQVQELGGGAKKIVVEPSLKMKRRRKT
jgi:hypothetical protein